MPGLFMPDRSFNFQAINAVFTIYAIDQIIQPYLFDKCLIVVRAVQEWRQAHKKE